MRNIYLLASVFLLNQSLFCQDHIHWGSTGDPLNGLTITWHASSLSSTGDQIKWGYTSAYEQGAFDVDHRDDYGGYLFDYTFPTLNANSTIHYNIYTDDEWGHATRTFQTSTDPGSTQFSFIAGGDSRTNMSDWQTAANWLANESTDFHLFLGDHVNSGTSTTDWTYWYNNGVNYLERNLIYHTAGNHEYGSIYLNQFVMPENERWYSFEFGNALFICLLTEEDFSTQYTWLVEQLSTTDKTWKIVFFHKPFFCTGSHVDDMTTYRDTWWQAFDDYGVDVILGGHVHYYLRSKPINLNVSSTAAVAEYGSEPGQGRLQILSGSYGAPVYAPGTGWFIEENLSTMNYTKFEIDGEVLVMNAYNMVGTLIDNVTINKGAANIADGGATVPSEYSLDQNYPNPFNPGTTILYSLPLASKTQLSIYNVSGQLVTTLTNNHHLAGKHSVHWEGTDGSGNPVSAGVYFCRLRAGAYSQTIKMVYLR